MGRHTLILIAAGALALPSTLHAQLSRPEQPPRQPQPQQPPQQPTPRSTPAASPAPSDRDLEDLVSSLAAPDLATRRTAFDALRIRQDITLKQVERILRTGELSPEQHRRLVTIAWHRFRNGPRPAMGVRTDPQGNTRGAVLAGITRGFPAEAVLRPGDRIESLDGVRLDDFTMLRFIILSHDPGDELPATVVRDGAVLNLRVKLGRYEDLQQPLDDASLIAAFRQFRARDYYDYRPSQAPLDPGVPPEEWSFHNAGDVDEEWSRPIYATGEPDPLSIIAGGEPRGGRPVITAAPRPGNARLADELQEFRLLQLERANIQTEIIRLQGLAENPRTDADTRRGLRQLITIHQDRLRAVDRQLRVRTNDLQRR